MTNAPFISAWRARLLPALQPRGRKADLARYLAGLYGGEPRTWQAQIQAALKRQIPSGELVLAIDAWLAAPQT